jgi:hypothetical protein
MIVRVAQLEANLELSEDGSGCLIEIACIDGIPLSAKEIHSAVVDMLLLRFGVKLSDLGGDGETAH